MGSAGCPQSRKTLPVGKYWPNLLLCAFLLPGNTPCSCHRLSRPECESQWPTHLLSGFELSPGDTDVINASSTASTPSCPGFRVPDTNTKSFSFTAPRSDSSSGTPPHSQRSPVIQHDEPEVLVLPSSIFLFPSNGMGKGQHPRYPNRRRRGLNCGVRGQRGRTMRERNHMLRIYMGSMLLPSWILRKHRSLLRRGL